MTNSKSIVELKSVYRSYLLGETLVKALQGVDLSIQEGDFTALVGASGSGKSTLLNVAGTIDRPDKGQVLIDSVDVSLLSEKEKSQLRNEKIGFVFQSFNLVPVLNVFENVELPLLVQRKNSLSDHQSRVHAVLKDVGLENFHDHRPDQLSGGQRQRVAIARALVTNPRLILADEPTANLDSKTTHSIIDLLVELNQRKKVTFLFCSHDEKLVNRVSKVIHIQDGKILP
jgi:putative ABC transport system ATP-binding protein